MGESKESKEEIELERESELAGLCVEEAGDVSGTRFRPVKMLESTSSNELEFLSEPKGLVNVV